jgi:hypothetical protein
MGKKIDRGEGMFKLTKEFGGKIWKFVIWPLHISSIAFKIFWVACLLGSLLVMVVAQMWYILLFFS